MMGMEHATHFPQRYAPRPRAPRLTFNFRLYAALLGFLIFGLFYVAIGIRWHTYRAQAWHYAQREMEATLQADAYLRAARNPGAAEDAPRRAAEYRRLYKMYARVAEECTQRREFYERAW